MPYESAKQSRFIHAKAAEGVPWARKFVADAHGSKVPKRKLKAKRKKKASR